MRLMIGSARKDGDRDRAIGSGHAGGIGFEHDVAGSRLEQDARHLRELGPHLARRQEARAAGDHERAAGKCAPAVGRAVGIAVHDLDALRRSAEFVGDDLRQGRAQTLTVRGCTDARLDEPGGVHAHIDGFPAGRHLHAARGERLGAIASAFAKRRHAQTEVAPFGTRLRLAGAEPRHAEGFDRRFHRFDIACVVEDETRHRGMRKGLDQVAATHLDRVEAESRRRLVHQPLDRKRDHRTRDAAVRGHRTGVGQDSAGDAGIFAHVIGAGQLGHGHQRLDGTGCGIAGISADIGDDIRGKADHLGVGVERALERDRLVATMEAGNEILAAVLHPCDRRL